MKRIFSQLFMSGLRGGRMKKVMRKNREYSCRKRIVCLALVMIMSVTALTGLFPVRSYAAEDPGENVVRVGYVNVATYEEGGEGEYKTGSGYEYLQKISYFTGWKYEYVYGTFSELYEKLKTGEIDLLGNVSYTEERAQLFHFASYPQGKDSYYLYTQKGRSDLLGGDVKSLNGAVIGVTKGSYQEGLLKQWLQNNSIQASVEEYDGYNASMEALDAGEIDAIATPNLASKAYEYATIVDIGFSDYYFAVANGREDLLAELNSALYEIQAGNPNYNAMLENKYQYSMISDTYINEKERQWLNDHNNTIRLGYLDNNLPYSGQDKNGQLIGVFEALAEELDSKFHVTVDTYCYETHEDLTKALKDGEVDAIGPNYSDYWLAEQSDLIQTNAVVSSTPLLFFKNSDVSSEQNRIAVSDKGLMNADAVRIMFPDAQIVECEDEEACLKAVFSGKADSTVAMASQVNLVKQMDSADQLQMLEIAGQVDICICTSKADPELANIINKAITSAGELLSGATMSQNSYEQNDYSLQDFIRMHMTAVAIVIILVIVGLLLVVLYMIRMNHRIQVANREIIDKQEELQEALQAAEVANRSKSTFLANMSHDIRTPINGIMGMLEIIDKSQEDPEKIQECLGKIRSSSELLLQLINDVLDLSRLESGQIILEHVPFNLRQAGEDSLAVVEGQAEDAGLRTVADHIDGTDIWLIGSPLHYKQIMLNLYTNAIKYNKPGGLLYTNLEIADQTDDILTLRITVKDTGIGMTQEFIDTKLFQPFIQGENGPRTTYKGTGLGMSIVKEIVDAMHGTISVESEPGKGSTFTVLLPFEIDHSSHEKIVPEEKGAADVIGVRALLVEDNELNMEIAQFILEDAGVVVTKAENGAVALQTYVDAPAGTFDVILMDIMMPVMDGLEAAQKIRNSGKEDAKSIPIFAMTANAFSEDAQKSLEAGMNEHIAKPIDAKRVIALIAKYVKDRT